MSKWVRDGNRWTHGDVELEFDPDDPPPLAWTAQHGTRSGNSRATPIEALDMLARYLAEDWEDAAAVAEVRAARDAWLAGGELVNAASLISVVDDCVTASDALLKRIENLEEALADALATIAELRREMRDMGAREGL